MPLINRFKGILQGAMVLTGNTLQVRLGTAFPPAGNDYVNGSYISTNTSLIAGAGFPAGTTFISAQASSSAVLNIQSGSTVVFAQLYWSNNGGTNAAITLTTPIGANSITPDIALYQSVGIEFRGQDVTSIVNSAGSGVYTVSNMNGSTISNGASVQSTSWYLMVVYKNSNLPFRYFNINTGASFVSNGGPSDFTFSNLVTPSSGPVKGYLVVSESNGDLLDGARLLIGTSLATATQIGNASTGTWNGVAPYAQINNMLPGNILNADTNDSNIGLLDTRGTFGTYNKNPFNSTAPAFARNITDILGIDISNKLSNNQTTLFSRVTYGGSGSGIVTNQSIQVDINAAILNPKKTVNKAYADLGDTLTYTVAFTNTGLVDANDVVFMDTIPLGVSFVSGSVFINNTNNPTANPALPGILLGSIILNQTTTVTFNVLVTATIPSPNPISNSAQVTYNFIPATGQPREFVDSISNVVTTRINNAKITSSKQVNKLYANVGDILTYTIPLIISGNVSANNVVFLDTIPNGTTLIANSLKVNGVTLTGSSNPPGLTLGNLPGNAVITITYKVYIDTIPIPNPIPNSASTSYSYIIDPSVPIINSLGSNTNIVNTQINNANLGSLYKITNKIFSNCGETIKYTIVIPNSGNVTAQNIFFKDTIPNGTIFVTNSIIVNNTPESGINPGLGFTVPDIGPGKTTTITYNVIVWC